MNDPAIWVYLSTILFILGVIFKSYKFVDAYFTSQQRDIIDDLAKADDILQKAQALYEEYRNKMEDLDAEADLILKRAHEASKKLIADADLAIDKIAIKKGQEYQRRIEALEQSAIDQLVAKYATSINEELHNDAVSGKYQFQNFKSLPKSIILN